MSTEKLKRIIRPAAVMIALGAAAIGIGNHSEKTHAEQAPVATTATLPNQSEKTARNPEITPEMQAELAQASAQVQRRVKGTTNEWEPIGGAVAVRVDGKTFWATAGHIATPIPGEVPHGNSAPRDIIPDSGYEFRLETLQGTADIDGFAVSQKTGEDYGLIHSSATNSFDIRPLKFAGLPNVGDPVATYTTPESSKNGAIAAISTFQGAGIAFGDGFNMGFVGNAAGVDPFAKGASGRGAISAKGLLGVMSFDIKQIDWSAAQNVIGNEATQYPNEGGISVVNESTFLPYVQVLA